MRSIKILIVLNYSVLAVWGYLFVHSLSSENSTMSKLSFFLLAVVAFICLGLGWLNTIRRSRVNSGPYGGIRTGSFKEQLWMVRTHVMLLITSIVYLNIFLTTVLLYLVTNQLHYTGVPGFLGFLWSLKLADRYISLKRELVMERNRNESSSDWAGL